MCSWCYGFGPQLTRLLEEHPGSTLDVVMGGLRAYNREPMSDAFREMLRGHWDHVAQASGLPMSTGALENEEFIYDTEPACRAVVTGRSLEPRLAFGLLKALQHAFYAEGRDITRARILAEVASSCGYVHNDFLRDLESEEMRQETRGDFTAAQRLGVGGFPTLVLSHGEELYLITSGYAKADVLEERIEEIVRFSAAAKGS
jgi:putative protein-disulfide isomerase